MIVDRDCDPPRGSARSRCKNSRFFAILAVPARLSAGIGVVEVQKLEVVLRFCGARMNPLLSLGEPSAEIVRVEALSLWRCAILLLAKWPLEVVSWFARLLSQSRGRGFDSPLVRGSSGSSKEAVVCGVYSWRFRPENRNPEAQTYSPRSASTAQLRLSILRTDTSAERFAERKLAQSNVHRTA